MSHFDSQRRYMQALALSNSLGKSTRALYSECQAKGLLHWRTGRRNQESLANACFVIHDGERKAMLSLRVNLV